MVVQLEPTADTQPVKADVKMLTVTADTDITATDKIISDFFDHENKIDDLSSA